MAEMTARNIKMMNQLMMTIRNDVAGNAARAKEMQSFLESIGIYININPLWTSQYNDATMAVVNAIQEPMAQGMAGLPLGGSRVLFEEVAKNHTMDLVTKMGDDMKKELSNIVADGLKQGQGIQDISKTMQQQIGLSQNRANMIARTESMRSKTMGHWYNYNEQGYGAFIVPKNGTPGDDDECADYLDVVYDMDQTDMLPPYHPNCEHVPMFFRTREEAEAFG